MRFISDGATISVWLMPLLCLLAMPWRASGYTQVYHYTETGLPVCYIETNDPLAVITKEEYIPATLRIEQDGDTLLDSRDISIRLRGNSTIWYEKKPYKVKFSKKTAPFPGMSKDKSFALLANYTDKSLMRAAIGFKIGELLDNGWTPRSQYVELVLNGEYLGNYQFTENVKKAPGRVDISDTGFLIEYEYSRSSSQYYFTTLVNNYIFSPKYPEEEDMIDSLFLYAEEFMNEFENRLYLQGFREGRKYAELIDEDSFAKWYYQKNLLQMDECNRYYAKYDNTDNSRLFMAPLWDFEWCLGVGPDVRGERPSNNHYFVNKLYFQEICSDSLFMKKVSEVHRQYGERIRSTVIAFYNQLKDSLALSQQENFKRWPILDKPVYWAYVPLGSWEAEVECDLQFFLNHYEWLDQQLEKYISGVTELSHEPFQTDNVYLLTGQRVGKIPHGLYVRNNKKYWKAADSR